jgi:hypothetical protein
MSPAGVERVIDDSPILLPTKSCGVFVLVVDPSRQRLDPGEQGREQVFRCHLSETVIVEDIFFAGRKAFFSLQCKRRPSFFQPEHWSFLHAVLSN